MSNLMVILSKIDEVTELRRLLDKTMKNCKESTWGNLLTEQITVNYLSGLGSDARVKLEEFVKLKEEEGLLESGDNEGLAAITRGEKEAQRVIDDVETLLRGEYPQQEGAHEGTQAQQGSESSSVPTSAVSDHQYPRSKVKQQQKPQCHLCKKIYTRMSSLNEHLKSCGNQDKPKYACPKCGKQGFSTHSSLTRHSKSCGGTISDPTCSTCKKTFPNMGSLRRHEPSCDSSRSTMCPACGKNFSNIQNLRRHEPVCQPGAIPEEPKRCSKCSSSDFATTSSLKRHELNCRGVANEDKVDCDKSHDHTIIKRKFPNFDAAVQWVEEMEFKVEFRVRSSARNYKYYQCRRNRKYNEKKTTCGNVDCSAGFSITGTEKYGLVKGCVQHGHPPLKRFKKIPPLMKMELVAQISLGRSLDDILQDYMNIDDYYKPLTIRDLQRLKATFCKDNRTDLEKLTGDF